MSGPQTAYFLLASGLSSRFGGDKLVAPYKGEPLLAHAARLATAEDSSLRFAIVGADQTDRRAIAENAGWTVLENPAPEQGQSLSLKIGVDAAEQAGANAVLILLGDMPDTPRAHLSALRKTFDAGHEAVMTACGETLCPPAIFQRRVFPALTALSGDRGAKSVFLSRADTATVPLAPAFARDIDTQADLASPEALHG